MNTRRETGHPERVSTPDSSIMVAFICRPQSPDATGYNSLQTVAARD